MGAEAIEVFAERKGQILVAGADEMATIACDKQSLSGAVSQRACVFCGARVVLYPITDALHLVHGPIGCAAYTWDIRGSLSSGPELHRLSFSTDLREKDVIFGGEPKLELSLRELIKKYQPRGAFVYSTCVVGVIGDDLEAVCKRVAKDAGIPVIPVMSEGFKGTKRAGYSAACTALSRLVGTAETTGISPLSINLLGDFNLAGEIWIIRKYYEAMGLQVVANITGDGRIDDIRKAHGAALNIVQCSGATMEIAKHMKETYGTPFLRASYFGIEDMAESLYAVARHFQDIDWQVMERARKLVAEELVGLVPELREIRKKLTGKTVAIYVGGAFKAFSLIKAFRHIGMKVVLVGSQTGTEEDYREIQQVCDPGTVIVDDTNPLELGGFLRENDVDILVGGVKERPLAHKLGIGFVDHNHERKLALEGFVGMRNFALEVLSTVDTPIWRFVPRRAGKTKSAEALPAPAAQEVLP
ncbi:MAG: nitrogenase iron-molybdenum cofactor biosynthesis protein NifE [Fibrobacteria bacterium]|nr:nitrogenase iron-molybdenum cofactor biosynthesis protein NifE [Fibrobacteria bacterium]